MILLLIVLSHNNAGRVEIFGESALETPAVLHAFKESVLVQVSNFPSGGKQWDFFSAQLVNQPNTSGLNVCIYICILYIYMYICIYICINIYIYTINTEIPRSWRKGTTLEL